MIPKTKIIVKYITTTSGNSLHDSVCRGDPLGFEDIRRFVKISKNAKKIKNRMG